MRMESLENTRKKAEGQLGTLREALELLRSGRLYQQDLPPDAGAYDGNAPADLKFEIPAEAFKKPVGYVRPGAAYLLERYGNTVIYSEKFAGPDDVPLYEESDRTVDLERENARLRRENEKLTEWKQNIVQLCVDLGAMVQDWTGGDTSKGFAHYFISSLYTRAVKAEAMAVKPGWLNLFFALQQEERKRQEFPLRAH